MKIKILGSGAGGGLPQWNCNCANCRRARSGSGHVLPRTQSSIAVSDDGIDWVLVNASPDILSQLRADPDLRHIPVIFMTAKSDPAETARLRESAIGLIAKPFDPMALGGQVRALWSAK